MTVFFGISVVLAALIGLMVPFGLFVLYRVVRTRSDSFTLVILIWIIGLGSLAIIAFSQRTFGVGGFGGYQSPTNLAVWASRALNLAALALAIVEILRRAPTVLRGQGPERNSVLWLASCGVFASWALSSIFGTKPEFQHTAIYPFLVLTAVFLQSRIDIPLIIRQAKAVVACLIWASLLSVLFWPDKVVEDGYRGLIPGLNFRLHGLTTHANSLGPTALLYLILEHWYPSRIFWRWSNALAASLVLVLTQSKTGWIAAVLCALILMTLWLGKIVRRSYRTGQGTLALTCVLLSVMGMGLVILASIVAADPIGAISRVLEERVPGLGTLTGRDRIWQITLDVWKDNPLFGYGPALWAIEFRMAYGLPAAGQAHNQFMQTLGEAGIIGLGSLLFYLGVLLIQSFRYLHVTRGASICLFLLLLTRCITEAPFRVTVFLEPAFLIHLIAFLALIGLYQQGRSAPGSVWRAKS